MSSSVTDSSWTDPDDAAELTDDWFAKADFRVGETLVRKGGRPRGSNKQQVTLRVDRDVIGHFKQDGAGWQSRLNAALRKAAGL